MSPKGVNFPLGGLLKCFFATRVFCWFWFFDFIQPQEGGPKPLLKNNPIKGEKVPKDIQKNQIEKNNALKRENMPKGFWDGSRFPRPNS